MRKALKGCKGCKGGKGGKGRKGGKGGGGTGGSGGKDHAALTRVDPSDGDGKALEQSRRSLLRSKERLIRQIVSAYEADEELRDRQSRERNSMELTERQSLDEAELEAPTKAMV